LIPQGIQPFSTFLGIDNCKKSCYSGNVTTKIWSLLSKQPNPVNNSFREQPPGELPAVPENDGIDEMRSFVATLPRRAGLKNGWSVEPLQVQAF
jgi:hypothetical protein